MPADPDTLDLTRSLAPRDEALEALRKDKNESRQRVLRAGGFLEKGGE